MVGLEDEVDADPVDGCEEPELELFELLPHAATSSAAPTATGTRNLLIENIGDTPLERLCGSGPLVARTPRATVPFPAWVTIALWLGVTTRGADQHLRCLRERRS
jgi:hypothetical protein